MPPRKKQAPQAPSTMKELKDTLWKAADKLRGSLSASQYKDVILGLVFLKYVSDAYDERREAIRAELAAEGMEESQIEDLIDDPEQYQGYGVFVVPVSARWKFLAENTKGKPAVGGEPAKNIGQLIDEAMDAVMKANPTLGGTLPRLYNKDKATDYALTPGRYVGTPAVEDDGEPIDEKMARLSKALLEAFDESARLERVVREQLGRLR